MTTISYAENVGRGPDTSALLDAALAAGRQGEPLADLIDGPQVATNGMTLDSAVAYDRDKLAAAVKTLAAAIHQTPTNASVSGGQGVTFDLSRPRMGAPSNRTSSWPRSTSSSRRSKRRRAYHDGRAGRDIDTRAVATTSAETARAAAARMAADLVVARGEETWKIAGSSLAPLIRFLTAGDGTITPVFDESGLDPMLKTLAKQVNQKVRRASAPGRRTHRRHARQPRGPNAHRGRHEEHVVNKMTYRQAGAAARAERSPSPARSVAASARRLRRCSTRRSGQA